jgi:hypothetical protein
MIIGFELVNIIICSFLIFIFSGIINLSWKQQCIADLKKAVETLKQILDALNW